MLCCARSGAYLRLRRRRTGVAGAAPLASELLVETTLKAALQAAHLGRVRIQARMELESGPGPAKRGSQEDTSLHSHAF